MSISSVADLEAYCDAMDALGKPSLPVFVYDADLHAALVARYDDFGACSIRGHRIVWMEPQAPPSNAKRTYVNDVLGEPTPKKKRNKTKWTPNAVNVRGLL